MKMLIKKSILAGLLIGVAGCIYMSCENKLVGAILFSIALISILILQANLFTGKVGYIDDKKKLVDSLIILAFNLLTSFLVGFIYRLCFGVVESVAKRFVDFTWYIVLLKGFFTGALIYLAVELFKESKNILIVVICIVAFIMSGFYHCIADACYLGASNITIESFLYILLVIIGNSLGSLTIRHLQIESFKKKIDQ